MRSEARSEMRHAISIDRQSMSDERFEILLGNLLITGVIAAAAVVLAGGIIYIVRHGSQPPDYAGFHGEPLSSRTVSGILKSATEWSGRGLIQFGLLLLIATPVARVAFSLITFRRQRDWMYAGFTLVVMAVLIFSLVGHSL